jgi:Peptidase family S64
MHRGRFLRVLLPSAFVIVSATLIRADGGANHQVRNMHFGVSGGNVNDTTRRFCCSGTLGALVQDATGALYVLSNNHVLARVDSAVPGEDVSQPGLIDNGCRIPPVVADFAAAAPLGSNVDAALAALRPSSMDESGFIEDIGVPSSTVAAPSVGMAVAKSGRTTGFTTAAIGSVNTSVNVQYQDRCGQGRKFVVSYTNQIVVNSSSFSAGGDSGSLIVTNDSNHSPVGLLYAGSSSTTIANPAGEVLAKLSSAVSSQVSFVGAGGAGGSTQTFTISQPELRRANRAKEAHAPRLMGDPSVFGVGVGADPARAGGAAVVIYVQRGRGRGNIPNALDGVSTVIVETDPIMAYGWNMQPEAEVCLPQ